MIALLPHTQKPRSIPCPPGALPEPCTGSTRPLPPQSEVGVDAGAYARQLMGHAADAADELTPAGEVQLPAAQQPELSAQVGAGQAGQAGGRGMDREGVPRHDRERVATATRDEVGHRSVPRDGAAPEHIVRGKHSGGASGVMQHRRGALSCLRHWA